MTDEPDASDDDAEQPAEQTPIAEVDAVTDQLESGDYQLATNAIIDELTERLKNAEGEVDRTLALRGAGEVVAEIAAEVDDPKTV